MPKMQQSPNRMPERHSLARKKQKRGMMKKYHAQCAQVESAIKAIIINIAPDAFFELLSLGHNNMMQQ